MDVVCGRSSGVSVQHTTERPLSTPLQHLRCDNQSVWCTMMAPALGALSNQAHGLVLTSRMRVTQRRVQEDIGNAAAPNVDGLGRDVREDDAVGVDAPAGRLSPDARLPVGREAQQPQHRLRDAPQDVAPRREGLRVVLQADTYASRQALRPCCKQALVLKI